MTKLIVVVQVFIAEREGEHALADQGLDRVLEQSWVAPVGETAGHPTDQPEAAIQPPQQQPSGIRCDDSAIEPGHNLVPFNRFKFEQCWATLCLHRGLSGIAVSDWRIAIFTDSSPRCIKGFEKSGLALVLQFRDTAAAKLSSFAILERVLRDQFEIVDDECGDRDAKRAAIRDPKDVPCDTVGNPADPDASYNAHKGQGYMAQIVETYCEDVSNEAVAATPDLITHVEVHKMTVHDGHRLADALDDLSERALTPAVMLGDSHYGSSDNGCGSGVANVSY